MTREQLVSALAARGINPATLRTARTEWLRSTLKWYNKQLSPGR